MNDSEKLQRLMAAVLMISADIELEELLRHVVSEARALAGARYAALGVLNETRTGLSQFITAGLSEAEEARIGDRPTGRGILGLLITDAVPLRLSDLTTDTARYGFPENHPPMTSFLGVPVKAKDGVYGNLYLTDKEDGAEFSDEDEALVEGLALAAGIAIANNRLHEQVRVMSVLEDRDRIARDLHDRVIQRVYAVGMSLQGAVRLPELGQVIPRVSRAIDDLDATITDIRSAIFELGESAVPGGLRKAVLQLADELSSPLGTRPVVRFDGPVDNAIPQAMGDHILAVVREALTNAGKHAQATQYQVLLSVSGDRVLLEVTDNGVGIELPLERRGLGLSNLRNRAEKLGGSFEIHPGSHGGTRLDWCVPL